MNSLLIEIFLTIGNPRNLARIQFRPSTPTDIPFTPGCTLDSGSLPIKH